MGVHYHASLVVGVPLRKEVEQQMMTRYDTMTGMQRQVHEPVEMLYAGDCRLIVELEEVLPTNGDGFEVHYSQYGEKRGVFAVLGAKVARVDGEFGGEQKVVDLAAVESARVVARGRLAQMGIHTEPQVYLLVVGG
jgi:hypothetical protein